MNILGETFDIHGGGIDLKFPHHEDERAQSEMATGKTFARYWLHNGHIRINQEKMSKSLGNFFTIKEIFTKYNPLVVRYFLLSTHYRMPIEFSDDLLEQAKQSLERLHDFMRRLKNETPADHSTASIKSLLNKTQNDFEAAMDNDFEIAEALAAIFGSIKEINILLNARELSRTDINLIFSLFCKFDSVLAVLAISDNVGKDMEKMIHERSNARKNGDFKKSDEIRDELAKRGIVLEDTKEGTVWKRVL
jgi:cysteinyl-tRNA synthetase